MTLQQFRSLASNTQREIVKQYGVFLLGRTGVNLIAKLYQLENFYIELLFDSKMSEVKRLRSFDDTASLEPYLGIIDISELYAFIQGWEK